MATKKKTTTTKKPAKKAAAKKNATTTKKPAQKTAPKKTKKAAASTKKAAKKPMAPMSPEKKARVFGYPFASIYPMYVQKVERKGRTKQELDEVLGWLTGYRGPALQRVLDDKTDLEGFFAGATLHPNAEKITGVVCGVRIEELDDPLMKKIRWMDKLVEELAQGRAMERILRA